MQLTSAFLIAAQAKGEEFVDFAFPEESELKVEKPWLRKMTKHDFPWELEPAIKLDYDAFLLFLLLCLMLKLPTASIWLEC